ncbi:flagellin [Sedimenticola thiotaurini]|uniref:Flagellin n=1 Tax=Sedimenticola thiotaurini TaxID=1543721 RepID=A0A0F7JUP0_9GAMM|nr:flagellin [Sedimenticola thiotaurini]AKH20271.1 flagellin [Sedimenticola thiotaurini]
MAQIINTNIASLTAQRNLNKSQSSLATAMERLSSGLRINSAKDDAAGLAISDRMTSQIRGLDQAVRNANDGISFAQTAEGALSTAGDAMQRIRELAVQAANDTNSASDRKAINNEVQQLIQEVNRIATSTQFNGQNILDGSLSTLVFQVGANAGQTISVSGVDARGSQLGAAQLEGASMTAADIATAVGANNLTVEGEAVDLTGATTQQDVIDAINAVSSDSGVTARAATSTSADLGYTANAAATTIVINGVSVDFGANEAIADAVDAINAVSNQTGVTAAVNGTDITFSNSDGQPITIVDDASNNVLGGDATVYSGIDLVADVGEAINYAGAAGGNLALGTSGAAVDTVLNDLDVLTRSNASDALSTIDFALQNVASLRAELGAVQVRFESTITNLSVTSENLSAARSRIQDADFAAETAEMTRSQILQQAGVAMVSQANALPQSVLSLLQ